MRVFLVLLLAAATAHAFDYVLDDEDGLVFDVRCTRNQVACRSDLKLFCNELSHSCNCVPNTAFNYTSGACQTCLVMTERTCPLCCPQKGWHCSNGQCKLGTFDYTNNMLNLVVFCGVVVLICKMYFICTRWVKKHSFRTAEMEERNAAYIGMRHLFMNRSDPLPTGSVALVVTPVVEAPAATSTTADNSRANNDRLPTYLEALVMNEYVDRPKAEASHATSMV